MDGIAFATGAMISLMLGVMQLRVDRARGHPSGYLLLWALGFVWTFGNFMRCVLDLAGVDANSWSARFAETFAWSCTLIGPIAIGRLLQDGIGTGSAASRRFFALTIGVSLLNLVLLLRANMVHSWRLEDSWYPATSFYIALGVAALAIVIYRAHRRHATAPSRPTPSWFVPAAAAFAAIHTAAILLSNLFPQMPERLFATATLIARHWTIPWSVLIAVALTQAHYADVVLKRSLWLLACVALATLIAVQMLAVPPGLQTLATVLALAASMLAAPGLLRALDVLVDKVILERPDYSLAMQALAQTLRGINQAPQLIAAALDAVRRALRVEARWVENGEASTPSPLASVVAGPHRLEITASHQARRLLHREHAFLEAVGKELELRLEALRFEDEQRALHLREERLKRLLTEAELKALRTQVDPHFLFNTLNTIADLIGENPQQAERMTERLAECFRYALAKHSRDLSTLDEELTFARHYLEIEQVRFGDRLRVQLSRGDASGSEAVPSLLLQPLLENAIRHGLAPVREGGRVSVTAHREGGQLRLSVEDDGVGMRPDATASGIGLRTVQERLRTLYGQAAQFIIAPRPGGRGTAVTLLIPLHAH
ncbi:MAG TPA: histidine kinase [Steroidobacteraceae bacterium]